MRPGARTPEELETLMEDAFLTRDLQALCDIFERGGVLVAGSPGREAHGPEAIRRLARTMLESGLSYLADPLRVVQARDTAVVLANGGINVVRRGTDGGWRYTIALLTHELTTPATQKRRRNDLAKRQLSAAETQPSQEGGEMTQETSTALQPLKVGAGEGEARWWFGGLAEIKATAADTGGLLSIIEVTQPPGMEAPLHVHYRDDEGFWILEGDVTFEVGDMTIEASAGDYVFAPRDIPHRYTVGDQRCRMLFIMVPGGIEDVLMATSEPAETRTLPPHSEEEPTPEEMEAVKAIIKEHGYELLV